MTIYRTILSIAVAGLSLVMAGNAMALPVLQLFIEGADYETASENPDDPETWAKLGTDSFRLWVLGSAGEGATPAIDATHRIRDVKFVASFADGLTPVIGFSPTTTDHYGPTGDPSTPVAVSGPFPSPFGDHDTDAENWSNPDGPMGAHGMLQNGRTAFEWNLGNFELVDSSIGNTQPGVPVEAATNFFPVLDGGHMGQINVYDMSISGLEVGDQVHFDVYGVLQEKVTIYTISCSKPGTVPNAQGNCTGSNNQVVQTPVGTQWVDMARNGHPGDLTIVNAPFSHDARWEQVASIPTPGTAALLLGGLIGLGWCSRRRVITA
ncbi:MAG: choice-of-anchor N protein [Alphaproteobacteria bacterium]